MSLNNRIFDVRMRSAARIYLQEQVWIQLKRTVTCYLKDEDIQIFLNNLTQLTGSIRLSRFDEDDSLPINLDFYFHSVGRS